MIQTKYTSILILILDPSDETLSDQLFFDIFEECENNLLLVNFVPLNSPEEQGSEFTPAVMLEAYP